jgi:imidazolonepropionase-like amidohydrolase
MLAIRAPRLFDGERFHPDGVTVFTDAGRIRSVEAGSPPVGPDWRVVEFDDATILPGLIDSHVHLVADSGFGALDRIAGFTEEEIDAVITDGLRRQLAIWAIGGSTCWLDGTGNAPAPLPSRSRRFWRPARR